jgi:hypothetical protein
MGHGALFFDLVFVQQANACRDDFIPITGIAAPANTANRFGIIAHVFDAIAT